MNDSTSFNKISGIYVVGFCFWNKVIRVFIRAAVTGSRARGEKGASAWRQPDIIKPINILYSYNAG
jgi:hypothetical protein